MTAYEALLALRRAGSVLDRRTRALHNVTAQNDPRMRVLIRLHGEAGGVPVQDLTADRGDEIHAVLDELDAAGMVTRSPGPPPSVRLSDLGAERVDEVLRQVAGSLVALVEGIPTGQLAVLRHVSLWLIGNHDRLSSSEPDTTR